MAQKTVNSAFMKPKNLSPELEDVVGKGPMPQTEVISKLWEYIKKHDLQVPDNKRYIKPDDKLAAVFGTHEPVFMMKFGGLLKKHIS